MRGQAPCRPSVRFLTRFALVAAAVGLVFLAACTPSAIRIPAGKTDSIRKIAVVPVEFKGISGQSPRFFHGGQDKLYLAGPRDNAVLGKGFGAVVVDGVPVFYDISRIGPAGPGQAERFEKLVAGPRERWFPAVDLAEIAARLLKAAGFEAAAEREVVRIPGVTLRSQDGAPLDGMSWLTPLNDWYGKDPDPLVLAGTAARGAHAVLVVAPGLLIPTGRAIQGELFVKLVDPSNGRVIGRAMTDYSGAGSGSVVDFPAAFEGAARPAVEKVLRELRLVRPE